MDNNSSDKNAPADPVQSQVKTETPQEPSVPATPEHTKPSKPKMASWKKALIIIGCILAGIVLLAIIIFLIVSATSKKFECTSSQGSITLMYSDTTINGYYSNGLSYDLDTQQAYAEQVGVENYLSEFNDWFEANTDGTCAKK